jgi:molybdate transport system substrate-binding protein
MSTVALTPAFGELTQKYQSSGNQLNIVFGTIASLKKRIDAGETADVMILSRPVLDDLQTQGKIVQGSVANFGKSYVAIGIRVGAVLPDIGTAEKLKAALLATKSVSYADPAKGGASGIYFAKVLDRLGIADQMKSRTILVPGAEAGEIVAKGDAEMGVAQASELASVPGIKVVGPLPGDLNSEIVFAVGIGSTSTDLAVVAELDAGILDHFAHSGVSFRMIAANSAGVLPTGSRPSSSNFLRTSGIARALTVSPVQFIQNILRRAGRRQQAEPRHGLEAGESGFRHGRQLGRQRRALDRGDGERAQFAFARQRHHVHDIGERHVDSVGEQVRHQRRGAAIGHRCNIDMRHVFEQFGARCCDVPTPAWP